MEKEKEMAIDEDDQEVIGNTDMPKLPFEDSVRLIFEEHSSLNENYSLTFLETAEVIKSLPKSKDQLQYCYSICKVDLIALKMEKKRIRSNDINKSRAIDILVTSLEEILQILLTAAQDLTISLETKPYNKLLQEEGLSPLLTSNTNADNKSCKERNPQTSSQVKPVATKLMENCPKLALAHSFTINVVTEMLADLPLSKDSLI